MQKSSVCHLMSSGKYTRMRHKLLWRYRTLSPGISANCMGAKSLGSAVPRKLVLSVSERKIKDNAISWYHLMLKWKTLNDAGFATANNIAKRKISLLSRQDREQQPGLQWKCRTEASKIHQGTRKELQAILDGLTQIQVNMEKWSSTTKGLWTGKLPWWGGDCFTHGTQPIFTRLPASPRTTTSPWPTCPCDCTHACDSLGPACITGFCSSHRGQSSIPQPAPCPRLQQIFLWSPDWTISSADTLVTAACCPPLSVICTQCEPVSHEDLSMK